MHSNAIFMLRKFDAIVPLWGDAIVVLFSRFAPDRRFASLRGGTTKQSIIFANNSIQLTYLLTKFNSL